MGNGLTGKQMVAMSIGGVTIFDHILGTNYATPGIKTGDMVVTREDVLELRADGRLWRRAAARDLKRIVDELKAQNEHALQMAEYDDYMASMDDVAGRGGY